MQQLTERQTVQGEEVERGREGLRLHGVYLILEQTDGKTDRHRKREG